MLHSVVDIALLASHLVDLSAHNLQRTRVMSWDGKVLRGKLFAATLGPLPSLVSCHDCDIGIRSYQPVDLAA